MKYLKKFEDKLSENIDFGNEHYKLGDKISGPLPLDIQETLTDLFYVITDCGITIKIEKGTIGGYENNIGIHIGNVNVPLNDAIKFNFDEIYILAILEVIDYLESKGRKLDYFWYRNKLHGIAKHIYPKDVEKELRKLPTELYFIELQFVSNIN